MATDHTEVRLGLRANRKQFALLVLVNAFVGGMVGLERTILPEIAEGEFGVAARTAILSFIVVFGLTKAVTNYYMGRFAQRIGRRKLLILGWIFGLPVPLILMFAPSWAWIVGANVLLGVNQGLCWSSTVIMKIDLVGERHRGLAMGLNEAAGYIAVGVVAFLTGWIAAEFGPRPHPFYLGIGLVVLGLVTSVVFIRDTATHVDVEVGTSSLPKLDRVFWQTTWGHPNLGSISFAGMVNNLNDGMVWGLLPILLIERTFTLEDVGLIAAIYPLVWGVGQLGTGRVADLVPRKQMLFIGMLMQGVVLCCFAFAGSKGIYIMLAALLGVGTAAVYPTFLAAIADNVHPGQRAESIGIFRLWRDLGYAVGAVLTGVLADVLNIEFAMIAIGALTLLASAVIAVRMRPAL
ncbi:MAG: MFS transporter [Saprospiraceae bacterium]|nr:MFS transporter [Saprospiraceae bacterium]